MKTLILNFKNYPEVLGDGSLNLARTASEVASSYAVEMIVAPPTPFLGVVASNARVAVFSQSVGAPGGDKTTGQVTPQAVRGAGGVGTILNHSEQRVQPGLLGELVEGVKSAGLRLCLCAATGSEASSLARFNPEFLAVEPPELIGSGIAVSKAKPDVVTETVVSARAAGFKGKILCGAGIVTGEDVEAALKLGSEGVLVSSSVVKSKDWRGKLGELCGSLI